MIFRLCLVIVLIFSGFQTNAQQPVVSDSRVKTFVYNPNDVYSLLTHHGYQAHVEFSPKESIQTISLGDKTAWQIIASGRRLFIRPLVGGARTNMTVITNLHSYLFDIQSTKGANLPRREDLVYMVRFYYPDEYIARTASAADFPAIYPDQMIALANPQSTLPPLNFEYSFSGEQAYAPVKVFDDGGATYFKFNKPAKIFSVNSNGQEVEVKIVLTSDGFSKVGVINNKFVAKYDDGEKIEIFNDKMLGGKI